jgi:hypothetical protein
MTRPTHATRNTALARALLLVIAAGLLSGCETTGGGPMAQGSKPPEPMTRSRAATECWMRAEKDYAKTDLDRRADFVTKCIENKMRTAQLAPRG